MLLGLSKIIDCPGASVTFSTSVDLSDLCYGVSYPVSEPVKAEGTVRNTAGVLVICYPISWFLCATAFCIVYFRFRWLRAPTESAGIHA